MSVLLDKNTRVLIQGITGKEGRFWAEKMQSYGTNIVAGVTPFKSGEKVNGIPVYHSVKEALNHHKIDASLLLVPPKGAYDAILEALLNGINLIVVTAEGITEHDLAKIRNILKKIFPEAIVIGANSTGIISTGKAMMGFFPYWLERVYKPGKVGVLTRSGSLTNEITAQIVAAGQGTSSIVGVGGDAIPLTRFAEVAVLFENDPDTEALVMIGEIGGTMEEEIAEFLREKKITKPIVAFLGGRTAPEGKRMGHAGAIASGGKGTVSGKIIALEKEGAYIAKKPSDISEIIKQIFDELEDPFDRNKG